MADQYVFLWWRGKKSIVDHPKILAAKAAGIIDDQDIWDDEKKRVPGMPFVDTRHMGSVNHIGQETETKLERVYQFGPLPWDMVQKVLASDARIIMKSASAGEFKLVKAATYAEAQDYVVGQLLIPHGADVSKDAFTLGGNLMDSLDAPKDVFEKLKRPVRW